MKRLLLIVSLLICCVGLSSAQDDHFKFKGIPISGSIEEFGRKLVADGFCKVAVNTYKGKFLRGDSIVMPVGSDDGMIWRVAAVFGAVEAWSTLSASFDGYVDLYTEKYGRPTKIVRAFTGMYDNTAVRFGHQMSAVYHDACNYIASWELPHGSIVVKIIKGDKFDSGCIMIVYTDNANKTVVRKADLDEI